MNCGHLVLYGGSHEPQAKKLLGLEAYDDIADMAQAILSDSVSPAREVACGKAFQMPLQHFFRRHPLCPPKFRPAE
jgi:hypothetical protein